MAGREAGHALSPGDSGAGNESARRDRAGDRRRAHLDPTPAFVPLGGVDLDQILCHEEARTVARDNTVQFERVVLQIDKQRGRRTCAGLPVLVRRHLDGRHSVWWGPRCLGHYTATGRALPRRAA